MVSRHLEAYLPTPPASAFVGLPTLGADNPYTRNTEIAFGNKINLPGRSASVIHQRVTHTPAPWSISDWLVEAVIVVGGLAIFGGGFWLVIQL